MPCPVLELHALDQPGGRQAALLQLAAVMAWPCPDDADARRAFIAKEAGPRVRAAERRGAVLDNAVRLALTRPDIRAAEAAGIDVAEALEETGWQARRSSMQPVADALGDVYGEAGGTEAEALNLNENWQQRMSEAVVAGQVLRVLWSMEHQHTSDELAGPSSLRRACDLVGRMRLAGCPHVSSGARALKAWRAFLPAAPIVAAMLDMMPEGGAVPHDGGDYGDGDETSTAPVWGERLRQDLSRWLANAEAYREFAVAYRPPRSARAVLDGAAAWLVLVDGRRLSPQPPPDRALTPEQLHGLAGYTSD